MKGADSHPAGTGVELKHLQLNKQLILAIKLRWFLKHLEDKKIQRVSGSGLLLSKVEVKMEPLNFLVHECMKDIAS